MFRAKNLHLLDGLVIILGIDAIRSSQLFGHLKLLGIPCEGRKLKLSFERVFAGRVFAQDFCWGSKNKDSPKKLTRTPKNDGFQVRDLLFHESIYRAMSVSFLCVTS